MKDLLEASGSRPFILSSIVERAVSPVPNDGQVLDPNPASGELWPRPVPNLKSLLAGNPPTAETLRILDLGAVGAVEAIGDHSRDYTPDELAEPIRNSRPILEASILC